MPVFEDGRGWWFWGLDGLIGPYSSRDRAEQKYNEYIAYVVTAPDCHHE